MKEIGRRLKARREELGLSLEQAQAETKIRRRYIEALESGNEAAIPGEVYLKGFLRFYGNFLGLDGAVLVREYRERKEAATAAEAAAAVAAKLAARQHGARAPKPSPGRRAPVKTAPGPPAAKAAPEPRPTRAAPEPRPAGAVQEPPASKALPVSAEPSRLPPRSAKPKAAKAELPGWDRAVSWLKAAARKPLVRSARVAGYALVTVAIVAAAGLWYAWSHAPSAGDGGAVAPPGSTGNAGGTSGTGGGTQPGGGSSGGGSSGDGSTGGSSGGSPAGHWALVKESDARARYVVYGAPFTVDVEIVDRCWIRVVVDGKTVFEKTLEAGAKGEWTAQREISILFGRPQFARVSLDRQLLGPAGTDKGSRLLIFEAGSPPGGTGTGGNSGGGQTPGSGESGGGA